MLLFICFLHHENKATVVQKKQIVKRIDIIESKLVLLKDKVRLQEENSYKTLDIQLSKNILLFINQYQVVFRIKYQIRRLLMNFHQHYPNFNL